MAYEEKFRKRAVEFKNKGHTFSELKEFFGISDYSYYKWKAIFEKTGRYIEKAEKRDRKRKIDKEELSKIIAENPDILEKNLAEIFKCTQQAISKSLKKMNFTHKKRHSHIAKNQENKD